MSEEAAPSTHQTPLRCCRDNHYLWWNPQQCSPLAELDNSPDGFRYMYGSAQECAESAARSEANIQYGLRMNQQEWQRLFAP